MNDNVNTALVEAHQTFRVTLGQQFGNPNGPSLDEDSIVRFAVAIVKAHLEMLRVARDFK